MSKFEVGQKETGLKIEPQLTSFTGVGDVDRIRLIGPGREQCAIILSKLNEDAARYCILASLLGTCNDNDKLRRKLRTTRISVWEHISHAHSKLIPVLKSCRTERREDLERLYRAFSACLEFLGEQYSTTLLVEMDFVLHSEDSTFIHAGLSENPLPKKTHEKLIVSKMPGTDILSVTSFGSTDNVIGKEDLLNLKKEIVDLNELIYSMNQAIAIQSWEIDPNMESEKFSITLDNGDSTGESRSLDNTERMSQDSDSHKIRCVSTVIVIIMVVIIGGIVGILMGVLD